MPFPCSFKVSVGLIELKKFSELVSSVIYESESHCSSTEKRSSPANVVDFTALLSFEISLSAFWSVLNLSIHPVQSGAARHSKPPALLFCIPPPSFPRVTSITLRTCLPPVSTPSSSVLSFSKSVVRLFFFFTLVEIWHDVK